MCVKVEGLEIWSLKTLGSRASGFNASGCADGSMSESLAMDISARFPKGSKDSHFKAFGPISS